MLFVIDELPLLGRVQSVIELLTNGRKYGSITILGIQTIAQLRQTYGRDNAQTLLACLGTWLVLRCRDAETAKYMSDHFGDSEQVVKSTSYSTTSAAQGGSATESTSTQLQVRKHILGSEVQRLPDLTGYLDISGPYPIMEIKVPLAKPRKSACEGFIRKPAPIKVKPAPVAVQEPTQAEREAEQARVQKAGDMILSDFG